MMKFKKQHGIILLAGLVLSCSAAHIFAQDKKKKPAAKPAVTQQEQLAAYDSTRYSYFLFPQFYTYWPIHNNDTVMRYECYDESGNYMNMDTARNILDVQHIYFTKTHLDYTQTIIDAEGKPRPQPVTKKLYKYDRTSAETWSATDLQHRYTSALQEYRDNIVRTDTTVIIDPITGTRQVTIRKYYKVVETDKNGDEETTAAQGTTTTNNETSEAGQAEQVQKADVPVFVYPVPEFYFYIARKNKDTTLEFLCYDYRDSLMSNITNYDSVRYYSLFKSFTDSAHTYRDSNGEKKLLPVSSIIKRYDRISAGKWMSIQYPKNKYQELTEYRDVIVRSDSVTVIDPINDKSVLKVFNYYKVAK